MPSTNPSVPIDNKFHSGEIGEILGDRGHRYKRNTLALSFTAILVTAIDDLSLDPSAVPGVDGLSAGVLWACVLAILLYNGLLYTYHMWQDGTLFVASLEPLHLGHPMVLLKGKSKSWWEDPQSFHTVHRLGSKMSSYRIVEQVKEDEEEDARHLDPVLGKIISRNNVLHLRRKIVMFSIVDCLLPIAMLLIAATHVWPLVEIATAQKIAIEKEVLIAKDTFLSGAGGSITKYLQNNWEFVIAALVLIIAFAQFWSTKKSVDVAKQKREDDLSDRRLASRMACWKLAKDLMVSGNIHPSDMDAFIESGGYAGKYLFNNEIGKDIQKLTGIAQAVLVTATGKTDKERRSALQPLIDHIRGEQGLLARMDLVLEENPSYPLD